MSAIGRKSYIILPVFLGVFACSKASFRGGAPTGSTTDATAKNGPGSGPNGNGGNVPNITDQAVTGGPGNPSGPGGPGNPNGPGGPGGPGTTLPPRNTPGPDRVPEECIKGDKAELGWSGPAKECMDKGKLFNFDTNVCQELPLASFKCDWATVIGSLKSLEQGTVRKLVTALLEKSSQDGSKLVACGESSDKMRIAVQWIVMDNLPLAECNNTPRNSVLVTTGCYTKYAPGEPIPPEPTSENEKRQRTFECLSKF